MSGRRLGAAVFVAAVLTMATAWGLAVSVGAGKVVLSSSELPDGGFAREIGECEALLEMRWGHGRSQAGKTTDGEAQGPASFAVDDRGRIYVLDQVNRRVVRFDGKRLDTLFQLPDSGFDDIIAARDRIGLLSRFENRRVLIVHEDGRRLGAVGIAAGVPDISRLRVIGQHVCVECPGPNGMAYHPVGSLDGRPLPGTEQTKPIRTSTPVPNGDGLKIRRVDRNNIALDVFAFGGSVRKKLRVHSKRDVSAIVDVFGDTQGNVFAVWGLYRESPNDADSNAGRLVIAKYTSEGELVGRVETRDDYTFEPQRKVVVSDSGDVYQLITDAVGVRVVRWTLGR